MRKRAKKTERNTLEGFVKHNTCVCLRQRAALSRMKASTTRDNLNAAYNKMLIQLSKIGSMIEMRQGVDHDRAINLTITYTQL